MNGPGATLDKSSAFAALPPPWPDELQSRIRTAAVAAESTLVVLDDDPTGTQTVHDVPVITRWDVPTLRAELVRAEPCFFILTNSRSLPTAAARALTLELARNLRAAAAETQRAFTLVSRSDSTLRGHFAAETAALAEVCGPFDATLVAPYFEAGGRYTIDDTHYVADGARLVPAAQTAFARDAAFGYRSSNLREWVEEKMDGRVAAADVQSLSLGMIRAGPDAVRAALFALPHGSVCIVNLCAPRDAEVFAAATLAAERAGKKFVYRTAASFVSARLGLESRPLLAGRELVGHSGSGGIIIVGSHVPATTTQLQRLLALAPAPRAVALHVPALLDPVEREQTLKAAALEISTALAAGEDVVVFTSRERVDGSDAAGTLDIGRRISDALVALVRGLTVRPRFLIAKGGITSSDVATRGLGVVRAIVRGQLLPGVPVWELGDEAKFPGLRYVVFPGNVGDAEALAQAYLKFHPNPSATS